MRVSCRPIQKRGMQLNANAHSVSGIRYHRVSEHRLAGNGRSLRPERGMVMLDAREEVFISLTPGIVHVHEQEDTPEEVAAMLQYLKGVSDMIDVWDKIVEESDGRTEAFERFAATVDEIRKEVAPLFKG
jgi:hypothetical protein